MARAWHLVVQLLLPLQGSPPQYALRTSAHSFNQHITPSTFSSFSPFLLRRCPHSLYLPPILSPPPPPFFSPSFPRKILTSHLLDPPLFAVRCSLFAVHCSLFTVPLQVLTLEHVVALFTYVLLERRVLLVSSQLTTLTLVSEALRVLLCPLSWSHVFVPVLPHTLIDTVQCPTPFLMGIHSSEYTDDLPIVGDMCVCNLDKSTISDVAGATDEHLHPGQRGDGEAGGEGKRGGGSGSEESPRMPAMPDALRVGLLSRLQQALRVRGVNDVLCT